MTVLAAVTLGLTSALAFGHSARPKSPVRICGVERWAVKTLQDRPSLVAVHSTTVAYLASRPAPPSLPLTRLPFERQVFRIHAAVSLIRSEADGDLHVVLRDGPRTMIAEAPSGACTAGATLARRKQMSKARAAVEVCASATVTGVGFFDFPHGQTGVAPNAIELHPILSFSCKSASPPAPAPPPPAPPPTPAPPPPAPPPSANCAPSYPDECIAPPPPDLDCKDIPYRNFRVLWDVPDPDPHHFDGDHDGIGCES
jgi:hypothetical protein